MCPYDGMGYDFLLTWLYFLRESHTGFGSWPACGHVLSRRSQDDLHWFATRYGYVTKLEMLRDGLRELPHVAPGFTDLRSKAVAETILPTVSKACSAAAW